MAAITRQQAVERLARAINEARPDDLAEYYNELFPEKPTTVDEVKESGFAIAEKILAHIDQGLEVQEILDLWHVTFPLHRRVWFDEEADLIRYDEKTEAVSQAD